MREITDTYHMDFDVLGIMVSQLDLDVHLVMA